MAYLGNMNLASEDYESEEFGVLPAAEYKTQVIKSSIETNKKQTGEILTLEHEVLEGEYKGRKIWDRLNISHESAVAEEISRKRLRKLVEAVGLPLDLSDSEKLHYKPVITVLKVEKRKDTGADTNTVSYYKSVNGDSASVENRAAEAAPAPKAQPWKKK